MKGKAGTGREPAWRPSVADYQRVIAEQNPWMSSGVVPASWAPPVERPLPALLTGRLLASEPRTFHLVLGPRRVGKTTCLYQAVRRLLSAGIPPARVWWLRLDHPLLMRLGLDALLAAALDGVADSNEPAFVFLDELTYAQDWDLWLKTFYDERWPLRIAGSSSSTAALRERRLESGVGRWEEQHLAPYSFGEFLDLTTRAAPIPVAASLSETITAAFQANSDLAGLAALRRRFLLTGGYPELLVAAGADIEGEDEVSTLLRSQQVLRNDAVERAIYKDIPQALGIDNPMLLERMLYTLAGQVTGLLSPQRLCQELGGLSQPTFDRYLSYLERAFLVFTLPNYAGREAAVQRRGRRLYFVDGAVRNAALQRGMAPLTEPVEMGLLYENMVAAHLHGLARQTQVRLYHWRERNYEVDLIYDHPEHPVAFEIASSPRHPIVGLQRFMERFPRFTGRCYLVTPDALCIPASDATGHVGILPLDLLLLAASRQAAAAHAERLAI